MWLAQNEIELLPWAGNSPDMNCPFCLIFYCLKKSLYYNFRYHPLLKPHLPRTLFRASTHHMHALDHPLNPSLDHLLNHSLDSPLRHPILHSSSLSVDQAKMVSINTCPARHDPSLFRNCIADGVILGARETDNA